MSRQVGQRAGRGFGRQQEVAEHHDPAAQGDVDRAPAPGPGGLTGPRRSGLNGHATSIVSPMAGQRTSIVRRIPAGEGVRTPCPIGWTFVLDADRGHGPDDAPRPNWRWRAERQGRRTRAAPPSIFDIDGVLSDAAGRQHFIERGNRDWSAFFEACGDDPVIEEVARLLELLDSSLAVVLLTGRPLRVQPQTLAWLHRYGLRWDLLVMRDRGRLRPGHLVQAAGGGRPAGRTASTCAWPSRTIPSNHAMYVAAGIPCVYIHSGYYE